MDQLVDRFLCYFPQDRVLFDKSYIAIHDRLKSHIDIALPSLAFQANYCTNILKNDELFNQCHFPSYHPLFALYLDSLFQSYLFDQTCLLKFFDSLLFRQQDNAPSLWLTLHVYYIEKLFDCALQLSSLGSEKFTADQVLEDAFSTFHNLPICTHTLPVLASLERLSLDTVHQYSRMLFKSLDSFFKPSLKQISFDYGPFLSLAQRLIKYQGNQSERQFFLVLLFPALTNLLSCSFSPFSDFYPLTHEWFNFGALLFPLHLDDLLLSKLHFLNLLAKSFTPRFNMNFGHLIISSFLQFCDTLPLTSQAKFDADLHPEKKAKLLEQQQLQPLPDSIQIVKILLAFFELIYTLFISLPFKIWTAFNTPTDSSISIIRFESQILAIAFALTDQPSLTTDSFIQTYVQPNYIYLKPILPRLAATLTSFALSTQAIDLLQVLQVHFPNYACPLQYIIRPPRLATIFMPELAVPLQQNTLTEISVAKPTVSQSFYENFQAASKTFMESSQIEPPINQSLSRPIENEAPVHQAPSYSLDPPEHSQAAPSVFLDDALDLSDLDA